MAGQITTADELDALGIGAVVVDRQGDPWMRDGTDWISPETASTTTSTMVRKYRPLTVVHLPDRDLLAEAEACGAREALLSAAGVLGSFEACDELSAVKPDGTYWSMTQVERAVAFSGPITDWLQLCAEQISGGR